MAFSLNILRDETKKDPSLMLKQNLTVYRGIDLNADC